jgi:hypothetical protein
LPLRAPNAGSRFIPAFSVVTAKRDLQKCSTAMTTVVNGFV